MPILVQNGRVEGLLLKTRTKKADLGSMTDLLTRGVQYGTQVQVDYACLIHSRWVLCWLNTSEVWKDYFCLIQGYGIWKSIVATHLNHPLQAMSLINEILESVSTWLIYLQLVQYFEQTITNAVPQIPTTWMTAHILKHIFFKKLLK